MCKSEDIVQSQILMFILKMFAKACFRSSRQWQMYLLLAGGVSQQMGLLPTVLPGSCWAVQLAACHFLDEAVALQIISADRVTLTCLHI